MLASTWYKEASPLFLLVPMARFSLCWVEAFILPLKDFASLPKLAFPIEDFDVGGVLEGQVKGRGVGGVGVGGVGRGGVGGGRGGINGPALLPHPCRSYSKWPH